MFLTRVGMIHSVAGEARASPTLPSLESNTMIVESTHSETSTARTDLAPLCRHLRREWDHPRRLLSACVAMLATGSCVSLTGCRFDSFMDPSVTGRFEDTAIRIPILDRIAAIETDQEDTMQATEIQPSDLIAEPVIYKVGPGDTLTIDIFEFISPGQPYVIQRRVDERGYITVPQLGSVNVAELTEAEIRNKLVDLLDPEFVRDPVVSVVSETQRQATYNVIGGVGTSNTFFIPEPNFRLLDAIATSGGIPDTVRKIRIVRQVPLKREVELGHGSPERSEGPTDQPPAIDIPTPPPAGKDDNILDLIDDAIDGDKSQDKPGVLGLDGDANTRQQIRRLDHQPTDEPPAIDVPAPSGELADGDWAYLGGQWVQIAKSPESRALAAKQETQDETQEFDQLVTQRVIEIPVEPLMDGLASYNLVVRPNDIIMIPTPRAGLVHFDGQINRGGTLTIPTNGRLTLKRGIAAAGGLGPLAVPENVEIHRILNDNLEAIVMLNLRAIMDGAEPDVYLKPDDLIVVGTTWWAAPLAVLRNGFRTSYGFGFLLDRNFGSDVFGAPPTNRFGQQ